MQIWYLVHAVSVVSRKSVRSETFEKVEAYMMVSVHKLQSALDMWPNRAPVTAVCSVYLCACHENIVGPLHGFCQMLQGKAMKRSDSRACGEIQIPILIQTEIGER
jgi:hypothetical protein